MRLDSSRSFFALPRLLGGALPSTAGCSSLARQGSRLFRQRLVGTASRSRRLPVKDAGYFTHPSTSRVRDMSHRSAVARADRITPPPSLAGSGPADNSGGGIRRSLTLPPDLPSAAAIGARPKARRSRLPRQPGEPELAIPQKIRLIACGTLHRLRLSSAASIGCGCLSARFGSCVPCPCWRSRAARADCVAAALDRHSGVQ